MAVKTIKYVPKFTQARTEYREIAEEDLSWIKMELWRWLAIMAELDQLRDPDSRWVLDQWWHKRTQSLPKGQHGPNTPASFVGGLCQNLVFGTQRDLTNRQMEALQTISHVLSQAFNTCTAIRFQIGFDTESH
jgi:hypothetical protein